MPRIRRYVALCVAGAIAALVLAPAAGAGRPVPRRMDTVQECNPGVTERLGVATGTPASPLALDLVVLHDGIERPAAETIIGKAARSYASLNITFVPTYKKVALPAQASDPARAAVTDLLTGMKGLVGGVRPTRTDAVLLLTTKDIYMAEGDVVGYAECIGGVRYADRSFAIAEAFDQQEATAGGLNLYVDLPSKTVAHELGHLLGARHDHANCAEGAGADAVTFKEPAVCTLMTSYVDLQSRRFGAIEASVIRDYAEAYANN